MLSVKLATETYCRDETDPIKQTGSPDFLTESIGSMGPGVRRAGERVAAVAAAAAAAAGE